MEESQYLDYIFLAIILISILKMIHSVSKNHVHKIPCKRHKWTTEDYGEGRVFMYCTECNMIPNSDTETTSYKEEFKK